METFVRLLFRSCLIQEKSIFDGDARVLDRENDDIVTSESSSKSLSQEVSLSFSSVDTWENRHRYLFSHSEGYLSISEQLTLTNLDSIHNMDDGIDSIRLK